MLLDEETLDYHVMTRHEVKTSYMIFEIQSTLEQFDSNYNQTIEHVKTFLLLRLFHPLTYTILAGQNDEQVEFSEKERISV